MLSLIRWIRGVWAIINSLAYEYTQNLPPYLPSSPLPPAKQFLLHGRRVFLERKSIRYWKRLPLKTPDPTPSPKQFWASYIPGVRLRTWRKSVEHGINRPSPLIPKCAIMNDAENTELA